MALTEGCRVIVQETHEATFRDMNEKIPGDYWIEFDGGGGWWSYHPSNAQPVLVDPNTGCYPGCYYYTDSCFRKDCFKTNDMTKPTAQVIADMTNAVLTDLNIIKQHLGLHTFNKTEEAWAGIETFIAIGLRVFAQTNPSKLRDVMRTVEIQTRMNGKEVFE